MFDKGEAREWRGQVIFRFLAQLEGGALLPFGNEREWAKKILGFAEYEAPVREQDGLGAWDKDWRPDHGTRSQKRW